MLVYATCPGIPKTGLQSSLSDGRNNDPLKSRNKPTTLSLSVGGCGNGNQCWCGYGCCRSVSVAQGPVDTLLALISSAPPGLIVPMSVYCYRLAPRWRKFLDDVGDVFVWSSSRGRWGIQSRMNCVLRVSVTAVIVLHLSTRTSVDDYL